MISIAATVFPGNTGTLGMFVAAFACYVTVLAVVDGSGADSG